MLRRLKVPAAGGFPSFVSGYRKSGLQHNVNACRRSSIHHVVNHGRRLGLGTVRHYTKPGASIVQSSSSSSTSASCVVSMTTLFHGTFLNHKEQVKKMSTTMLQNENENEDEEMTTHQPLMMMEDDEDEWLDATIDIVHSSKKQSSLIMTRIYKEIPLLIQDFLAEAGEVEEEEGHHQFLRHGNASLATRYQNELHWIRKRMETNHVATITSSSSTSSFNLAADQDSFDATTSEERAQDEDDAIIKWRASPFSVQDKDGDHFYDGVRLTVADEEDLFKPHEASLIADSTRQEESTNIHPRHDKISSPREDDESLLPTTTTIPATSTSLDLLASCLALLRAMSRHDWTILDDQALLLKTNEEEQQCATTQESKYDNHAQSSTSDHGLIPAAEDYDDSNSLDHVDDDEDDDEDDELFWTLRQLKVGGVSLESTNDFNLVLARIALAAELDRDDILEALFDTLHQIKAAATAASSSSSSSSCAEGRNSVGPNAMTYEILLLVMLKRLGALRSGLDLVRRDMVQPFSPSSSSSSSSHLCTTATLEAAIQLCEKSGDLSLARELWRIAQSKKDEANMDGDETRITNRVHHSMLNMFKAVDGRVEAIEILRISLQDNRRQINNGLDRVFVNAINWPTRNRKGESIDNLPVLVSILDLLDEDKFYKPGVSVFEQLLISVAKGDHLGNHARWKVVQRIFMKMFDSFSNFHLDQPTMSIGLEASEALSDSTLAAEIITRMLDFEFGQITQHQPSSNSPSGLLSSKSTLKAMDICVNNGDAASARRILDCVEAHKDAAQIPRAIRQRLYVSTLKVYGNTGQGQVAEQLLAAMLSSDVEPT
jgi:hypothetical protein